MLGISAEEVQTQQQKTVPMAQVPGSLPPQPEGARTMIGVAMPGVAPILPPAPNADASGSLPPVRGEQRTMLGVAMPGIAPTRGDPPNALPRAPLAPAPLPAIVPAPAPLVDEPLPPPPVLAKKGGLPLGVVAGVVGLLVAAAGVGVYFFWRAGAPLVVKPRLGPQGNEQLHLSCPTCPDGTKATASGNTATFKDKEASLELATPLKLGDNPLEIHLDRPSMGRDETVKASILVPYRVKVDLANTATNDPIVVRVETTPGTTVKVDGHDVALDGEGKGTQPIDVRAETEGASDEGKVIDRTIPYEVTPKGSDAERGTLNVRVGVVPLHIDAPSAHMVTDADRFVVAGRTAKGASVMVNGKSIEAGTGIFFGTFELPADKETAVEIRASGPNVAPRTARYAVRRVANLDTEAKAFEAANPLGYDTVAANVEGNVGKGLAVDGEVRQSRTVNHQTVAVVDSHRGCAKKPCLVRVVYGSDLDLKPRQELRAYGKITRAFSAGEAGAGGKPVPEVEADFVIRGKIK
ncbi:hypothetical protein LVJ94_30905 [Pendulispora rubella]|uniref:Uncharacterized protein n=1 Tax=Pendulispora rubella TaxID=2741070 RepID=A0ABZ2KWD2_9BACT